jgi:hypothetical protein
MPIKQITPQIVIQRAIEMRIERVIAATVRRLCSIGEQVVTYARDPNRKRYTDRTGNLTSSIGYAVIMDGEIMQHSGFGTVRGPEFKKSKGKESGSKSGRQLLAQLISEYQSGIVLIVVAGMSYAVHVEAKGLDVLDSAEIKAQDLVRKFLDKFNLK